MWCLKIIKRYLLHYNQIKNPAFSKNFNVLISIGLEKKFLMICGSIEVILHCVILLGLFDLLLGTIIYCLTSPSRRSDKIIKIIKYHTTWFLTNASTFSSYIKTILKVLSL